ncbi:MAG: DNA-deoxyinosine glycosylase [Methanosarcinaceae archaeon]|nr:DNA-deoxyinosine glycosylase [Methanosarcinaceae archaeon]
MIKKGLAPMIDKNTRILILGSLPSDESISKQQYYSNPGNDFWKLINEVIGEDITTLDYEAKVKKLQEYKIGLWDVYLEGERSGNKDSNIINGKMNDFSILKKVTPNLHLVCFNGKEAGKFENTFKKIKLETRVLLSSSGANRSYLDKRIVEWKSIADAIN